MKREDLKDLDNIHSVYNPKTKKFDLIDLTSGEVVSSDALATSMSKYVFSFDHAVQICQAIRKGRTIADIGKDERFPPVEVLHLWIRMHPDFKAQVELAKKDRAENYHDKIIALAEDLADPLPGVAAAEVASKKTAVDAYKWAAEKNDPDRYGKKQEVKHTDAQPTQIIINTGISRHLPDVEDVECKEVKTDE